MIASGLVTFQNEFRIWPILKALFQSIPFVLMGNDIVFSPLRPIKNDFYDDC